MGSEAVGESGSQFAIAYCLFALDEEEAVEAFCPFFAGLATTYSPMS